jgi:peptide/nickel transport system permease protein
MRLARTRVGLVLLLLVVGVALIGPFFTPYNPNAFVGPPFGPISSAHWLGMDYVGRDVLSRFLAGGRTLLILAVLATVLGVGAGTLVGLVAGYSLRVADEVSMRFMDLLLAFPPIVLALMCVSVVGPAEWLIVLVVALSHMPQTARVIRAAVVQVRDLDFIKYAQAIGVSKARILREQVLPNVVAPLTVEFGLRLTFSIGLIASLDYLGLGVQPPKADWGVMIQENQSGLNVSPWPVLIAVAAIAVLTIGSNLVTDGIGHVVGGIDRRAES